MVDFEDLEPQMLTFRLNSVLVGSQERLLVNATSEYLMEVRRDQKQVSQSDIAIDELDRAAHDQSDV